MKEMRESYLLQNKMREFYLLYIPVKKQMQHSNELDSGTSIFQ